MSTISAFQNDFNKQEDKQKDAYLNSIGIHNLIHTILASNEKVNTESLRIYSNLTIDIESKQSNYYLKCVDTVTGEAQWAPVPYLLNKTLDSLVTDVESSLSNVNSLEINDSLTLSSNLHSNAILLNANSQGEVKWVYLTKDFQISNDNIVPNACALSNLYQQTLANDAQLSNILHESIIDKTGLLITSSNLADLENVTFALSNLGLDRELVSSNIYSSNLTVENDIIAGQISTNMIFASNVNVSSNLSVNNLYIQGDIYSDQAIATSNIQTSNIHANEIHVQNTIAESIDTSNITISSNVITNKIKTSNIELYGHNDNNVLMINNNLLITKQLTSSYSNNSTIDIPNAYALSNAVTYMESKLLDISDSELFSEKYLQIDNRLNDYSNYTITEIQEVHSNLQIQELARTGTWEDIQNIPLNIQNIETTFLKANFENISTALNGIAGEDLRNHLGLSNMAHQNEDSVNISGGRISGLSFLTTEEFILDSNSSEIVVDKQNDTDKVFLYLRNIEPDSTSGNTGTGKWTNLPIKQYHEILSSTTSQENSITSAAAFSNLYNYLTQIQLSNSSGVIDGFLNSNYSDGVDLSKDNRAASAGAVIKLHNFIRSPIEDLGFLVNHFSNDVKQNSVFKAPTTKAMFDLYRFMRNSNFTDGFLNDDFSNQTSRSNAASTFALTEFYNFVRSSNNAFLVDDYRNVGSSNTAATSKAVHALINFIENSNNGFLIDDFRNAGTSNTAATSKTVHSLINFIENSNNGFLIDDFRNAGTSNTAATSKTLHALYDYIENSNADGFLNREFSNQLSHSNAATTAALSKLYTFMRNSNNAFLIDDFRNTGTRNTASTSKAVHELFQFMEGDFIAKTDDINSRTNAVSAGVLSNMYYNDLTSSSFFTSHNTYLTDNGGFLLRNVTGSNDDTKPFTARATSNLVDTIMNNEVYNMLSNNNYIEFTDFKTDDPRKVVTTTAVSNLYSNTAKKISDLNDKIYKDLYNTTTNIALSDRITIKNSNTSPIVKTKDLHSNIEVIFNYDTNYFKVEGNSLTVDDAKISNIAAGAIQISSSPDVDGFSNLIAIDKDPAKPGKYLIKFDGTSLLDEVSHDVTRAVANALFRYGEADYTFNCNVFFSNNIDVTSNIYLHGKFYASNDFYMLSNAYISSNLSVGSDVFLSDKLSVNSSVFLSDKLSVYDDVIMSSNAFVSSNLSVGSDVFLSDKLSVNSSVFISGNLSVNSSVFLSEQLSVYDDVIMSSNAFISSNLSVGTDVFISDKLSVNSSVFLSEQLSVYDDVIMSSNAFVSSNLSVGSDVFFKNKLSVSDEAIFSSGVIIEGNISVKENLYISTDIHIHSNLSVGGTVSLESNVKFIHDDYGHMELTTESSNDTIYTYKLNFKNRGGFKFNEFELSNVNKVYLGGDSTETYASNLYASNITLDNNIIVDNQLSVGGESTFNDQATFNNYVITGTIQESEKVSNVTFHKNKKDNRHYCFTTIDSTESNDMSTIYSHSNVFVNPVHENRLNINGDLSVSQTIVATDLNVNTIEFTNIVGNIDGAQITGGVDLASNVMVTRDSPDDSVDNKFFEIPVVNSETTKRNSHPYEKNLKVFTNSSDTNAKLVFNPKTGVLSVPEIYADGNKLINLNASQLSVTGTANINLNSQIKITQSNLNATNTLSVGHAGKASSADSVDIVTVNDIDPITNAKLLFYEGSDIKNYANIKINKNETGDDYSIDVGTTQIKNNVIKTDSLSVGESGTATGTLTISGGASATTATLGTLSAGTTSVSTLKSSEKLELSGDAIATTATLGTLTIGTTSVGTLKSSGKLDTQ